MYLSILILILIYQLLISVCSVTDESDEEMDHSESMNAEEARESAGMFQMKIKSTVYGVFVKVALQVTK